MKTYNKTYKMRLLPNKEQKSFFAQTFGCVRFIWNKLLEHANNSYKEHGKAHFITPASFKQEFSWLKEVDSLALANVWLFLKQAFTSYFEGITQYPRFKRKDTAKQSYTTNNQEASQAIRIEGTFIRLPKVGFVKIIMHRQIKPHEKIKRCTVTQTASGNYYISITVEGISYQEVLPIALDKVLGLDYSMTSLYVSSEGERANYPRYYRKAEEKLVKLCQSLSRKVKGSKNWHKARRKLAIFYEYIAFLRHDFLHKLSFMLAKKYDAIIIEDLDMHAMSQALNFGKSVGDNGWGKFVTLLGYKLAERGKQLIKIDKWFPSSKMCSSCGSIKESLALSERWYNCQHCGYSQDRDINAARNIRTVGITGIA